MKPEQIISGGQTGADQGVLFGAETLGIKTGGMMPKGFRTQAGPMPDLAARFGLVESTDWRYPPRTEVNVRCSDGTVIIGNQFSPGCSLTIRLCKQYHRPYIVNPSPEELRAFVIEHKIKILNGAGNREETNPGIFDKAEALIIAAFGASK